VVFARLEKLLNWALGCFLLTCRLQQMTWASVGGKGSLAPWVLKFDIPLNFWQKMLFSWFRVGKMDFHHFFHPWKNFCGYSLTNPLLPFLPENPSDTHADMQLFRHRF